MEARDIKVHCFKALDLLRVELAIKAPELCALFDAEAYVAGGAIASLLRGETPKDYDIFLRTEETVGRVKIALLGKATCSTDRALSFDLDGMSIQLITAHWDQPEAMVGRFDFVHCMGYYDYAHRTLSVPAETASSCDDSMLVYRAAANPVRSFVRAIKLEQRGWTLSLDTVTEIVQEIQTLDLTNPAIVTAELGSWY